MLPPMRTDVTRNGIGTCQLVGTILCHRFNQEGRLLAILRGFEAPCPVTPLRGDYGVRYYPIAENLCDITGAEPTHSDMKVAR